MSFIEKANNLPPAIGDFFSSSEPRWECEKVCFMYGIKDDDIEFISGPVGLIFVDEIKLKDFPAIIEKKLNISKAMSLGIAYEINKRIFNRFPEYFKDSTDLLEQWEKLKSAPLISEDEAWKKVLEIEPWILEEEQEKKEADTKARSEQQKQQDSLVKITLPDALKQYPELGEQLITSEKIALKNFPDPVRPSIKNWLSDYTYTMGHENKGAIERGNYVFQSVNGRKLTSSERQKLAYILSCADENKPLTVNKDSRQVIFPIVKTEPVKTNTAQIRQPQQAAPARTEPQKTVPSQTDQAAPVRTEPPKTNFNRTSQPSPVPARPIHTGINSQLSGSVTKDGPALTDWGTRQAFGKTDSKPPHEEARILEMRRMPTGNRETIAKTASIDSFAKQRQEIFTRNEPTLEKKPPQPANPKPETNINFSSPQKLSFEKEKNAPVQPQPPRNKPIHIYPFFPAKNDEQNNGTPSKNVINLKEQ